MITRTELPVSPSRDSALHSGHLDLVTDPVFAGSASVCNGRNGQLASTGGARFALGSKKAAAQDTRTVLARQTFDFDATGPAAPTVSPLHTRKPNATLCCAASPEPGDLTAAPASTATWALLPEQTGDQSLHLGAELDSDINISDLVAVNEVKRIPPTWPEHYRRRNNRRNGS